MSSSRGGKATGGRGGGSDRGGGGGASRGRGRVNEQPPAPAPQSTRGGRQPSSSSLLTSIEDDFPSMQSLSLEATATASSALPTAKPAWGSKPVAPPTSSPQPKQQTQPVKAPLATDKSAPPPQQQAPRQSVLTSSKMTLFKPLIRW